MLVPKFFTTIKTYNFKQFLSDVSAGVIVGIVALPLAIAFAIASGVTPDKGLITAVVAGFFISFLGGSRVQIGGPTGAFVVIVYGVVSQYGISGLIISTILAGVILILLGVFKLGGLIKYIPYPIITGFTSGIALTIFASQIKDFFGMGIGALPPDFIGKCVMYAQNITTVHWIPLGIGVISLLIILFWPKVSKKIPGSLVAIIVATALVQIFKLPVDTIQTRFGGIPSNLPSPVMPHIDLNVIRNLIGPSVSIALLCAIESLLSAVVADGMIGSKHRSNMELIAQGVANIASGLFGGIPATGAIARTATNIKNGGRTPVAGMVHALVLLLIMLFFGRFAGWIPMPCLAAILINVAYNMSEYHAFFAVLKGSKSDILLLLLTFSLTVLFDLTLAIEVGVVLAAFIFMKKMADTTTIQAVKEDVEDLDESPDSNSVALRDIPKQIQVFEIQGPFFFGTVDKFNETIGIGAKNPKVLILRMRSVPYMDIAGLHALEEVAGICRRKKILLLISDIHTAPLHLSVKTGFMDRLGKDHFFGNLDDAIDYATQKLGLPAKNEKPAFEPTVEREKQF